MRAKSTIMASASVLMLALASMPAAAQTAPEQNPVPDTTAEPSEPTAEEQGADIVVTGLRRSLENAQNIKRESAGIVDAIVAEDIGKLPDITASAALARVTGVQVNRAAGEAAQVQIRGLPDISTTYNGREIFTAENRFVAIQDFPAGAVAALEVYKSSTANLIEAGIGGQVNVRSRRPFDFDGLEVSGSFNGVHSEQSQKVDWNGNILLSDRFETGIGEIGVLINAAMTNIDFLDSTRENDRFFGRTADGVLRPNGQGVFYGSGNRWRPSVNGAIQWKPTDSLEVYVEGIFQGYRGEDRNHWMFSPLGGETTNVELRPDGSAQSLTVTGAGRPDGFQEFRRADTDTYQVAGGLVWTGDRLKLSGDVAYTDSVFREKQVNVDYAFDGSPVRDANFDISDGSGGGVFAFRDYDTGNPENYIFRGLFDRNYRASGNDIQARLDADWETGLGFIERVQLGVRYNDRNADRQSGQRYAPAEALGYGYTSPELGLDIEAYPRGFRYDSYQGVTRFAAPTFDSVFANVEGLRALVGFPTGNPEFNQLEAFTAQEKAYAGYAQVKYAFDPGFPIDGYIGLRVVRTDGEISGTNYDSATDVFTPVMRENKYTDYLPNASVRFEFAEGLQLRLAYTETRTRPNFDLLNPSTTFGTIPAACTEEGVDSENCRITASGGNPELQPLESQNYDISLEYYFSRTGSVTLAAFRRDTSNFIFRTETELVLPGEPDIVENRPFNAGEGRLQGIEAAFTAFLDFDSLPEWARGFGMQANYTYIDAGTELALPLSLSLPGFQPVPFVSEHAFNLVGIYERPSFSARLAYNWRSEFVTEYNDFQGFIAPTVQDSLGTLDFSATVTPIENLTFAFDALNILADPIRTYREYNFEGERGVYPFQRKYLERVYSVGIRFRF